MPAAASADGLNIGLNGCPARTIEHPFARWLDYSNYVLAPGGTFEGSMDGWKLPAAPRSSRAARRSPPTARVR